MLFDKSIAVVVPAYNEQSQISKVVQTMPDFVDTIVIIDDCSTDKTFEVCQGLQKNNPKIVLIRHEKNQGVGGGIASGYKYARDHNLDIAVVMAGDAQMDPKDLPNIIAPVALGEAEYSKANRLAVDNVKEKIPYIRLFGNSILSILTKIASGYWHVMDSQTGYTAIGHTALKTIDWDKMYKRYGQPNDLLVRLNIYNFRVKDVVTEPVYNVGEQSKLKVRKAVFSISKLLLKLFLYRMKEKYIIRNFHPLVLFYGIGATNLALALLFFVRLFHLWAKEGNIPEITLISLCFTAMIGLQSICFAMLFDMQDNRDLHR